jgi:hypothetical protein
MAAASYPKMRGEQMREVIDPIEIRLARTDQYVSRVDELLTAAEQTLGTM